MTSSVNPSSAAMLDRIRNLSPEQRQLLERTLASAIAKPRAIPRRTTTAPTPLSFGQQRQWFLNHLQPGLANYNKSNAVRLRGSLNRSALQAALDEIVRRHEVLRTVIFQTADAPLQSIQPPSPFPLQVHDLCHLGPRERDPESRRLIEEEAARPFDLTSSCVLRGILIICSDDESILMTTMHHIAMDAWSRTNLWRELSVLYGAFSSGQSSPLPDLPIQYADFAVWQREWLSGPDMARHLAYWQQRLANLPAVIELPADRPRPQTPSGNGGRLRFTLPERLRQSLAQLARGERVTLYMVLLAAYKTLLHRYTGQDDVVVGTPMSGRTRVETEPLIGYFVNTLVMRTDLSGNPTFRDLLKRMRDTTTEAFEHQGVPFERLVEVLAPERRLSHQPLTQVIFSLQNTPAHKFDFERLKSEPMQVQHVAAKFDLWFELTETPDGLRGKIEYNVDLFDAATIDRMLQHFQTLLEAIAAAPDRPIEDIPLLPSSERHQLLVEWNNTARPYRHDACLHELIEEQVARTPDAIAVVDGARNLTYRELNVAANCLARHLRERGIGPDSLVAISLGRTSNLIVGILAILKSGGAYMPLDLSYPRERLEFMLRDSAATVVLTQTDLIAQLPSHRAHVVCIDAMPVSLPEESDTNLPCLSAPQNLAYVLFTSGSTGQPKGVAIEHRNVVAFLSWAMTVFSREELAGVLASTSVCFDLSVFEMFTPLICGGKVILAANALALPSLTAAKDITLLNTVPSAIAELIAKRAVPATVKTIAMGGEYLPQHLVVDIYAGTEAAKVFDLYGPTEATVYATFALRTPTGTQTIGQPIANTRTAILDRNLRPAPIGITGEIHIGGDGVARGYLNRPELTAQRFIADPFGPAGSRFYKTGDLGRYLQDGNIEYLGRIDHQVKVSGFRIELGEIESALRQSPAVREAVVVAREDQPGDRRLVAYIVGQPSIEPTTSELREITRRKLPGYMIPSNFVVLNELPLTPNGKLDRRALPAPTRDADIEAVAPRDSLELQLTKIWEDVLNLRPIGVHDSFFDLGGHSLLAVRLFSRIVQLTGHELPLATLFECPTVAHLAQAIRQHGSLPRWKSLTPIRPAGSKTPLFIIPPASGSVLRFATLAEQLGPDQPVYGLEPLGRHGNDAPHDNVEQMATAYLEEILQLQPSGPYLIAGVCFGGYVAWEIAHQLKQQGQEVALVALLDSVAPEHGPTWSNSTSRATKFLERVAEHWANGQLKQLVRDAVRWRIRSWKHRWTVQGRNVWRLTEAHTKAQLAYVASPLECSVLFLQSEEYAANPMTRERWADLTVGKLESIVIPGTRHLDLLLGTKFTSTIATMLREHLDRLFEENADNPCRISSPRPTADNETRRAE